MIDLTTAAQTIKDNVTAQDVGQLLGLEMRHGRCKCPIHGGTDFNCVLFKGNRGFYCYVCKTGGDVISFAEKYHKMTFKDAVGWLNDTFHLGLDIGSPITPEQRRQAETAQKTRKEAIEFQQWKEQMKFDMVLAADQILEIAEEQRDRNTPKTPNEPWNRAFCDAVRVLPAARMFAEECMAECIKEEK